MITRSIRFRMALWYAALLAGALALFGAATYLGLERYLQKSLEKSLIKQARSIGDVLLVNVFWWTGDIDLLTIRTGDADEASIDFRRVVFCYFVIDVIFATLVDVDEQHVTYGACLFDQRLLQRLLKVTLQTEIGGSPKKSKRAS